MRHICQCEMVEVGRQYLYNDAFFVLVWLVMMSFCVISFTDNTV